MTNSNINDNVVVEIDARAIEGASESSSYVTIRTNGYAGSNSFAFGFTGPESFARRVSHGPIFNGPYLYGFGLGTCLHNGPIEARPVEIFVRTGDVVRVRDLVARGHLRTFFFVATVDSRGYVNFECVKGLESKMGNVKDLDVTPVEMSKEDYSDYLQKDFDAKRS